ncbi:hypothetical protein [Chryseolinea lacunae]|uniref:Uncharacterized protein n=1 Tax=Chryseolinea lacunae TaxID=2801331 RepID=A0ABS1KK20_9BACT|nr:hypothetical protein [Chryseolinea lacunae]MBL0739603.1 hypothetical protein [Chryseolinea lacunae]
MNRDLDLLIAKLEEEQASLERLIKDAVVCEEYLSAHYHREALERVGRQLHTLRVLDDPLFDRKQMLKAFIRSSGKLISPGGNNVVSEYFKNKILEHHRELKHLDDQGKPNRPDSEIVDQHLQRLMQRLLKGVRIVLKEGVSINIRRYKAGLKMTIPGLSALLKEDIIAKDDLPCLAGLGFTITKRGDQLTLVISMADRAALLQRAKAILAIVALDIFSSKDFRGQSYIEVF